MKKSWVKYGINKGSLVQNDKLEYNLVENAYLDTNLRRNFHKLETKGRCNHRLKQSIIYIWITYGTWLHKGLSNPIIKKVN